MALWFIGLLNLIPDANLFIGVLQALHKLWIEGITTLLQFNLGGKLVLTLGQSTSFVQMRPFHESAQSPITPRISAQEHLKSSASTCAAQILSLHMSFDTEGPTATLVSMQTACPFRSCVLIWLP